MRKKCVYEYSFIHLIFDKYRSLLPIGSLCAYISCAWNLVQRMHICAFASEKALERIPCYLIGSFSTMFNVHSNICRYCLTVNADFPCRQRRRIYPEPVSLNCTKSISMTMLETTESDVCSNYKDAAKNAAQQCAPVVTHRIFWWTL